MNKYFTANSKEQAWEIANRVFPTDYEQDTIRSKNAGYPIFYSTRSGFSAWISDLNDRLELNYPVYNENGKMIDFISVNVWIETPETPDAETENAGTETDPETDPETVRALSISMLTSDVLYWYETVANKKEFPDAIAKQIEHYAYVASMNYPETANRISDFIRLMTEHLPDYIPSGIHPEIYAACVSVKDPSPSGYRLVKMLFYSYCPGHVEKWIYIREYIMFDGAFNWTVSVEIATPEQIRDYVNAGEKIRTA